MEKLLVSKIVVYTISMMGSLAVSSFAQAQKVTFTDGNSGHVLENQIVNDVSISNDGTGVDMNEVTVNGNMLINDNSVTRINNSTINCTVADCMGLWAGGVNYNNTGQTTITASGLDITSTRSGITVGSGSANMDLVDLRIDAKTFGLEINSSSAQAGQPVVVKVRNFEITAEKYGVYGMFGPEIHLTNGSITTTQDNGAGLYLGGANYQDDTPLQTTAYLENVSVSTEGANAHGLYSVQQSSGTTGQPNRGALSYLDNSHISTKGNDSYGVYASYASNTVKLTNGSSITTEGNNAYGVYSIGNAQVILDNSHVVTQGKDAIGVYSYYLGNSYLQNGTTVITQGEGAHGTMLQYAGKISLDSSSVHTQGADAHGIYMLVGVAENGGVSYPSQLELQNSSIISDQGYGIATEGGNLTVNVLNGSMLKGGAGLMFVKDYTGGGTPAWDQGVTTVNLLVDGGSVVSGDVKVENAANVNMQLFGGSTWDGAALSTSENLLDDEGMLNTLSLQNATWNITDNSWVRSIANNGSIAFSSPNAGVYKTLDVGILDGNGTFSFNTDIVAGASDKLIAHTTSGSYTVAVANSGSQATKGTETLTIIETDDGIAQFSMQGQTELGGYLYDLRRTAANANQWELYAAGNKPTVTPAANAAASFFNASYLLNYVDTQTLRQRMGELRSMPEKQGAFWMRGFGGRLNSFSVGQLHNFDMNYWGVQAGVDRALETKLNGTVYVGVMGGYTKGDPNYWRGKGSLDDYHVGFYGTFVADNNFYVDGTLKYVRMKNDFNVADTSGHKIDGNMSSNGWAVSAEVGKRIDVGAQGVTITPQLQVSYAYQGGDNVTASNGLNVDIGSYKSLLARVGGVLNYQFPNVTNPTTVYIGAHYAHEFDADTSYRLNGNRESHDFSGSWGEVSLGVTSQIERRHNLYGELKYSSGSRFDQTQLNIGYRLQF